jgi:NAD(P)-dependent dehydrogenase (short-subunit alcohol dehydrogenase family)
MAAMDALAVSYAAEVARFGIESAIVEPGSFAQGTNHFANSGRPADLATVASCEDRYPNLSQRVGQRLAALAPQDADVAEVATVIVEVVNTTHGERPFRSASTPQTTAPRWSMRSPIGSAPQFLTRIGVDDVLHPPGRRVTG